MDFKLDKGLINTIKGSQIGRGLSDLKVQLALIQAASAMALEGINRATASQIADRAIHDYGIEATPSFTGQVFSSLNINSVTSHGRSRFVLEYEYLDKIRKDIASRCEEKTAKLKEVMAEFKDLPENIDNLQSQWQEILKLRRQEKELIDTISEASKTPPRLNYLKSKLQEINEQAAEAVELENEIKALSRKVKKIPSLQEKKKSLKDAIAKYEEKEQELTAKEQKLLSDEQKLSVKESNLAERIDKLQKRLGWVELATLEQNIESAKHELKQLSKQLGEKRSLLDKMLGRNKGGASP